MDQRIVEAGDRTMSRGSGRDQPKPPRYLLARLDVHGGNLPAVERGTAALGEGELGVDIVEMLTHHVGDADAGGIGFFAGFGQENQIAGELGAPALGNW